MMVSASKSRRRLCQLDRVTYSLLLPTAEDHDEATAQVYRTLPVLVQPH